MKTEMGTFKEMVTELGYTLNNKDLNAAFIAYKRLRKAKEIKNNGKIN